LGLNVENKNYCVMYRQKMSTNDEQVEPAIFFAAGFSKEVSLAAYF
jgi:hypothetical protein